MQCFCLVSHSFIWICEHSPDLLPPAHPTFWSGKRFCNHRACWVPTILKHEPYRNLSLFGTNPLWQEWWFISRCQWSPTSALPITHISYCPLYSLIYLLLFLYFLIDTKLLDIPSFPIQHTQIPQPQLTPTHGSHFPTKHKYPDLFHSHSSVHVSQTAPFHPTDD